MSKKPTVVICSSANFYKHVNEIAAQLKELGVEAVVPKTALIMAKKGDYDAAHYKTWFANADDYDKKAELMRTHFDEVKQGDIVLVVNDEKHGKPNYIGANVLMEMSLGWYLGKPIYVINDLPVDSPFEEEIKGMGTKPLHGDLRALAADIRAS